MKLICSSLVVVCLPSFVFGDVRLPSIIGDNMVLQQDCDARIWGCADPGEKVDVTPGWGGNAASTVANEKGVKKWEQAVAEAEKQNQKPKRQPDYPARNVDKAGALFNGWIRPITNMSIKGVIWYQGESNTRAAYTYRELFPALIKNWRCDFKNFDMPFYFVQLANFTEGGKPDEVKPYRGEPRDHEWAELREAQFMANQLKNTGMAVTIDIGDSHCIHPSNKRDCGERLARRGHSSNTPSNVIYSGPLYAGYTIEEGQICVYFDHAEGGLLFRDGKAKGFAIAGKDRKFVWGDAKIEGETVVVSSDQVKEPVAVRYGWDIDPEVSLYNKAELPASPFRTDDWHGLSFGKLLPKR